MLLQKSSILSFKYVPGYHIVTTTKLMRGLCLRSLELLLCSEHIQRIMSKLLRFMSYFHHERSWSSLKSEKIPEIERLDYTEKIFIANLSKMLPY